MNNDGAPPPDDADEYDGLTSVYLDPSAATGAEIMAAGQERETPPAPPIEPPLTLAEPMPGATQHPVTQATSSRSVYLSETASASAQPASPDEGGTRTEIVPPTNTATVVIGLPRAPSPQPPPPAKGPAAAPPPSTKQDAAISAAPKSNPPPSPPPAKLSRAAANSIGRAPGSAPGREEESPDFPRPNGWPLLRAFFSKQNPLSAGLYMALIASAGAALVIFNWEMSRLLEAARRVGGEDVVLAMSAVWLAVDAVGFAVVTQWTIRRWADACGDVELPFAARWLLRLAHLSPLPAAWVVFGGCAFPTRWFADAVEFGTSPRPRNGRSRLLPALALSLAMCHGVFLLWANQASRRAARAAIILAQARGVDPSEIPAPPEVDPFERNLALYVPPGARFAAEWIDDDGRLEEIRDRAASDRAATCPRRPFRMGQIIEDCFFSEARVEAKHKPFMQPALAAVYEILYRTERSERRRAPASVDSGKPVAVPRGQEASYIATAYVAAENALNALQNPDATGLGSTRDRGAYWSLPLAGLGSIEAPLVNGFLDWEQSVAAQTAATDLETLMGRLPSDFDQKRLLVTEHDRDAFLAKRAELLARIKFLKETPFAHWPPAP